MAPFLSLRFWIMVIEPDQIQTNRTANQHRQTGAFDAAFAYDIATIMDESGSPLKDQHNEETRHLLSATPNSTTTTMSSDSCWIQRYFLDETATTITQEQHHRRQPNDRYPIQRHVTSSHFPSSTPSLAVAAHRCTLHHRSSVLISLTINHSKRSISVQW